MLIHSVVSHPSHKFVDIPPDAISEYLELHDRLIWVALSNATPEELNWLENLFDLPDLAMDDVRYINRQRPKLEEYGDTLFAILRLLTPTANDDDAGEFAVFAGANYVISLRYHHPTIIGVRDRCESEPDFLKHGPGFILYALMDAVVDRYFPLIEQLESDLDQVEARIFAESAAYRENIETLYAIRCRITCVKHAVFPLMEATGRLSGGRTPYIASACQEYFRDVHDHLIRMNAMLDTQRETAATAIQVNLSLVTIEAGDVTKRLAAWAGIFAVATAFAGIWGMNFRFMPELDWPWGYPAALLAIAGTCGFLYYRFKKTGWL